MKNTIGQSVIEGSISAFVLSLFHDFGKVAEEKGMEFLKSKAFGIGTNDEYLFLSACSYALEQKWITKGELQKIRRVIDSFEASQRSRIIGVIGKEESEVTSESPKLDNDNNIVTEKKTGKTITIKTTEKVNLKGARILAMLAKLSNTEIKKILETSGASDSLLFNVKQKASKFAETVKNSEVKKDGDRVFANETWLGKMAREAREKKALGLI